jgi:hypothetical protein
VRQTRGLIYPRTRRQGLRWWEERIRRIDAGARAIPPERLLTVSLDELLVLDRRPLRPLCRFLGVGPRPRMRQYFTSRMNAEKANQGRWRKRLSRRRVAAIETLYEEILAGLEADGVGCAPLLRRTLERSRAADRGQEPEALAYLAGDGTPAGVEV